MSSEALKLLTVTYPAGERIVAAGESGTCMFVVQDGAAIPFVAPDPAQQ